MDQEVDIDDIKKMTLLLNETSEMSDVVPQNITKVHFQQPTSQEFDNVLSKDNKVSQKLVQQNIPVKKQPQSPAQQQAQPVQQQGQKSKGVKTKKIEDVALVTNEGLSQINLFGKSIPKHTFYLIIIVTVLGLTMWWMTREKEIKSKKKKKNDEDDE